MTPEIDGLTWWIPLAVTLTGGVLIPLITVYLQGRKQTEAVRHSDRELLSADERDFRKAILEELRECHQRHEESLEHNRQCLQENAELRARIVILENRMGVS